jgi:hypothetical protein
MKKSVDTYISRLTRKVTNKGLYGCKTELLV